MNKKTRLVIAAVLLICLALASRFLAVEEPPQTDLPLLTPAQVDIPQEGTPLPEGSIQPGQPVSTPSGPEQLQPDIAEVLESDLPAPAPRPDEAPAIAEDGSYDSKEDVALYIHTYGKLPSNYITKAQARALGWEGGSVEEYAPGKCIGGDHFGNYEGTLPDGNYTECDIDTLGYGSRGSRRIVFSDDGRIYYTHDHYENFEQLY